MSSHPDEKQQEFVDYLLDRHPDREAFLDRLFGEEGFTERLDAAEREMLDEYVRGGLQPAERRALAERYNASESQHAKLAFAYALRDSRRTRVMPPSRGHIRALAAAAGVLLCWTAWLAWRQGTPPARHAETYAKAVPAPRAWDVNLSAGQVRGAGVPSVRIPAGTATVVFHLEVTNHASSDASGQLRNAAGEIVSAGTGRFVAEAGSAELIFRVPAAKIKPGRYWWHLARGPEIEFAVAAAP